MIGDPIAVAAAEAALACLTPDEMEQIRRRWFTRSALRHGRSQARHDAIRDIAAGLFGNASSGRALARTVGTQLSRYAGSAWRHDKNREAPRDPRHLLLHRVLRLGDGRCPGQSTIRLVLSGLAQNRSRK